MPSLGKGTGRPPARLRNGCPANAGYESTSAVQAGQLEPNVMMPRMAHNLLQSFTLLVNFLPVFTGKCVRGITADAKRALEYAHRTAALGTVLNPVVGYLKAAELIKE